MLVKLLICLILMQTGRAQDPAPEEGQATEGGEAAGNDTGIDYQAYCALACAESQNVVCEFKCEISAECNKFEHHPMTDKERQYMLDLHNYLRNFLASGADRRGGNDAAANMMALNYDLEQEIPALCWARRCVFEHDNCRRTTKYEYNGQNLYLQSSTGEIKATNPSLLNESVSLWYQEIQDVTRPTLESFQVTPDVMVGHFTQIVWASTESVGCVRVTYRDADANKFQIVCNYGPGGNMQGSPVYEFGEPASKCPDGTKPNDEYPSLCGEIKMMSTEREEIMPPYGSGDGVPPAIEISTACLVLSLGLYIIV